MNKKIHVLGVAGNRVKADCKGTNNAIIDFMRVEQS